MFNTEINYHQIKEKLISRTISYAPDIGRIYSQLILNYNFVEYEIDILNMKKEKISTLFNNENHLNIRTLKFILNNYLRICKIIRKDEMIEEDKIMALNKIFDYLSALSIRYKKGSKIHEWSEEAEYGQISLSGDTWAFNLITGFKFVNDLVINSYLDIDRMNFTVKLYCEEQKKITILNDESVNSLGDWWYMKDDQVKNLIDEIVNKIEINKYQIKLYPKILSYFLILRGIGFSINIEEIFNDMIDNIKTSDKEDRQRLDTFGLHIEEEYKEEYIKYINKLNKEIDNNKISLYKYKINNYISKQDGWSKSFFNYISDYKDDFLNKKKFFSLIDVNHIVEAIRESSSRDIIGVRSAFDSVYNFSNIKEYFEDDCSTIKKIIDELNKMIDEDNFGLIKNNNLKYLLIQLESYIEKLS